MHACMGVGWQRTIMGAIAQVLPTVSLFCFEIGSFTSLELTNEARLAGQ